MTVFIELNKITQNTLSVLASFPYATIIYISYTLLEDFLIFQISSQLPTVKAIKIEMHLQKASNLTFTGKKKYATFVFWYFSSLRMRISSSIYSCANFTFKQLSKNSIVYVKHILIIHLLADAHLGCFQFPSIMNRAAINMNDQ